MCTLLLKRLLSAFICWGFVLALAANSQQPKAITPADVRTLPGTRALQETTPLVDRILVGTDRFLDRQLTVTRQQRLDHWRSILALANDPTTQPQWNAELDRLRSRLLQITGSHDPRSKANPQIVLPVIAAAANSSLRSAIAESAKLTVHEMRIPVLDGYDGFGLWIEPKAPPHGVIIFCPDAGSSLAQLCGLTSDSQQSANQPAPKPRQTGVPLQLAEAGYRVVIPQPISRTIERRGNRIDLSDREYVYRATFVQGRHPLGLELQTVLQLVDWIGDELPLAMVGDGEGGLLTMLATAIDPRIDAAMVSGYWGNREAMWSEPISRNVFDFLRYFDDVTLACMIAPRRLVIERSDAPEVTIDAAGAGPGKLATPSEEVVREQLATLESLTAGVPSLKPDSWLQVVGPLTGANSSNNPTGRLDGTRGLLTLTQHLGRVIATIPTGEQLTETLTNNRSLPVTQWRNEMLFQIENLSDQWIRTSRNERESWVRQLNTESLDTYRESIVPHRERFERDVIGRFDEPLQPLNVRSRFWKETEKCSLWEVEMDVFPEVIAGGILLVPRGYGEGEKLPVVVAVHGLEGQPIDTIEGDHPAYHDFATKMCERGYIVFAPQQLYYGHDRFRSLQRKANPLGKTLFSVMIPQHRQILKFLQSLPNADPSRIGFYGLSYGGKSAMRIPAAIPEYGPVICSGDFNEWVLKNGSTRDPFSYVWTPEYEIFEFDLGRTFNYAEMAALICPRPFMVERGHFDGVAIDRWVAFEYAPVRFLYAARLGIPDQTEIEWFVGPHTINGQGTYRFLDKHLRHTPR